MNFRPILSHLPLVGVTMLVLTFSTLGQTFAGQATAVRATVRAPGLPVTTTTVADTHPLNSGGGSVSVTSVAVSVPGLLTVGSSGSNASGSGTSATAASSVNTTNIGITGNTIVADLISSNVSVQCPGPSRTGGSTITNLRINGNVISISGAANQTVPILFGPTQIGTLIIDEQIFTPGGLTVNALHLSVTDPLNSNLIDVVVASSRGGITCAGVPAVNRFRGRGTGLTLTQSSVLSGTVGTVISDTGPLPGSGGSLSATTVGAGLPPILTTGTVSASTSGGPAAGDPNTVISVAHVESLVFSAGGPLGVTISADAITSTSQCVASAGNVNCTGTSTITNLLVTALGSSVAVNINGLPNQEILLPAGLGRLVINERSGLPNGPTGELTVNSLRAELTIPSVVNTELVVSSSNAGLQAGLAPTAASGSITGRVVDSSGRPISRATVRLVSGTSDVRLATTSSFGYFRFDDVPVNQEYVLGISSKRYRFEPRSVLLTDSLVEVEFSPIE